MPRKLTQTKEKEQQHLADDASRPVAEPNPRSLAKDDVVAAKYLTPQDPHAAMIRFNERPPQEVLRYLKDHGFHWNRKVQAWTRPIGYDTTAQDREASRRVYAKVVEMLGPKKSKYI